MKALIESQKNLQQAEAVFNTHFEEFWNGLTPLESDEFWVILEKYQGLFFSRKNAEWASWELMRSCWCGKKEFDAMQAISFAKTYPILCNLLYAEMDDWIEDYSDDGFSDLLDMLPLAGREIRKKILDKEIRSLDGLEQELKEKFTEKEVRSILRGENYNRLSLHEAAQKLIRLAGEEILEVKDTVLA
jgi:hypothetical protein